jgi:hypothetical protein
LIFHCFCLCLPGGRFLFLTSAARQKTIHWQTEQNEGSEGGEAGVVGVASAKHAPSFGARPALIRTDSTRPALCGRPPLRTEVGPSRASAPHRVCSLLLDFRGSVAGRNETVTKLFGWIQIHRWHY